MRYEHLIQINDPLFPLLAALTRAELWNGLVARAYSPDQFVTGLEGCTVRELSSDEGSTVLARTLNYGGFQVDDVVTLRPMESLVTDVSAGAGWAKSRLTITIEGPSEEQLHLRFCYEWEEARAVTELDTMTLQIREQAYYAADLDTVSRIRELARMKRH